MSTAADPSSFSALFSRDHIATSLMLAGGISLYAVETYVTATIMPSVVRDIGGLPLFAWVTTLYVTASVLGSVFIAIRPRGMTLNRTYMIGALLLLIGSFVCAVAPSMELVLVGRAVQGFGAGTLATLNALSRATARARLEDFDAVIIPEPFGEAMLRAQVGVCWMFVDLTGKPAHVAYMGSGVNPIEAGIAVMADLKELEAQWNAPEHRHPAFADQPHPINFNLGRIEGGEWNSSVPCTCTLGIRFSFYPDMTPEAARDIVAARVRATVARLNPALTVQLRWQGQFAPGCEFDLDAPAMRALAAAHEKATGQAPAKLACTATTDARHFRLMTDLPVTCYGPEARNIHGIDESVSIASMKRVATAMAQFIVDWCGVAPAPR